MKPEFSLVGVAELVLLLGSVLSVLVLPLAKSASGDRGDGKRNVVLPTPSPVSGLRVAGFVSSGALMTAGLFVGGHWLMALLQRGETLLARLAIPGLGNLPPFFGGVYMAYSLLIAIGLIAMGLFLRAPLTRRIRALSYAAGFLASLVVANSLLAVVAFRFSVTVGFFRWADAMAALLLGFLAFMAMVQGSLALPRAVASSFRGRTRWLDILRLGFAGLAATVVSVTAFIWISAHIFTGGVTAGVGILFALPTIPVIAYLALLAIGERTVKGPKPARMPSITVIMPAYNEEQIISASLGAIDQAAGRYTGIVNVVVADDGSSDSTVDIIIRTFMGYRHARGTIVRCPHRGKAPALNSALDVAETEIVIRIDADTIVDSGVFLPLPEWFANPEVGMVGALDLPHPGLTAWYSYGRLFECLRAFAFGRIAISRINAISCVPGTFTAFRASVARANGGFVEGMNGEDADLTIQFERTGYRVTIDTDIRIYEDVPQSWQEFRKQRVRWFRGGAQVVARNCTLQGNNVSTTSAMAAEFSISRFRAVVHPVMFVGIGGVLALFPGGATLMAKLAFLLILANVPSLLVVAALAIRHGYRSQLLWLPILIPFGVAKRFAAIESVMSIPAIEDAVGWVPEHSGAQDGGGVDIIHLEVPRLG